MRKLLLACVATLVTGGLIGAAFGQPVGAPTQGQQAWPAANPSAYVNNNNNYQARALAGPPGNPVPSATCLNCEASPGWITCPSC